MQRYPKFVTDVLSAAQGLTLRRPGGEVTYRVVGVQMSMRTHTGWVFVVSKSSNDKTSFLSYRDVVEMVAVEGWL